MLLTSFVIRVLVSTLIFQPSISFICINNCLQRQKRTHHVHEQLRNNNNDCKSSSRPSKTTLHLSKYSFDSNKGDKDNKENRNGDKRENNSDQQSSSINQNKITQIKITQEVDKFLDTQFFDPDKIIQQYSSSSSNYNEKFNNINPILWFAKLVKNDYQTAVAFYAAAFISILVIFTQEILRMIKYGDAYIPFTKIGSGNLF